ncbi:MAG: hypothetical protein GY866_30105 [Proteobacteria bacterium]|nr:hypothetical protein [Pseudomonadota bacterium]
MSETVDLTTTAGKVDWDSLKGELMSLPKESLAEMVNVWLKTFWSLQNYWMIFTEERSDFNTVAMMDHKIWGKVGPIQAYRVKKALNLGDDVQALATMFKFTAPQWAPAGFTWEVTEITDKKLVMTVNQCPMGTFRTANDLELLPCKLGEPSIYEIMSKVINEKFETTCLHAHPDPPKEGIMCSWQCELRD